MQAMIALKKFPLKTLALAGLMSLSSTGVWASASCTLTPASPNATFTINNLLDVTAAQLRAPIPFAMSCRKNNISINGRFCLRIGEGSAGTPVGTAYAPRWLQKGTDYAGFQIYKDNGYSSVWGPNATAPAQQIAGNLNMFGSVDGSNWNITLPNSGNYPLYVELLSTFPTVAGVNDIKMLAPGVYTSSFTTNTGWILDFGTGGTDDCQGRNGEQVTGAITFAVTANIAAQCKITTPPNDIDFGTQVGSATNLQGSTAVSVQCTRTTPYFIGLRPGNGNTAGAGVMNATSPVGNTDTVPYQLRQTAGMSGTIWGNTATSLVVGNGVAGTGLGSTATPHTIYATVPTANHTAGSYQDTVTITVNY